MKKLLLVSLVIHLLLLAALAPWLVTRMEFDRAEEARRTEEVSKRELARKEQERLRRERIRLDRETADMLRREAEKIRRKEMARELDELRKIRERIFEERERELDRFRKRRAEDVVAREKKRVQRMAAELVHHAAEARRTAEQQKESPEDAEKLLEQARKLENRLNQENALTTEREELVAEVETFERSADEASKEETADQTVRNAFARTERSAGDLRKALEELGPKTDMAAMNDTSAAGETETPPSGGTSEEAAEI
ncbi:MAG: hypothetical protein KDN05_23755, partial [Verrucomicrobiae bacterium]|nr:hypothetical protein [Verrucomicrobiae bacterium]